MVKLTPRVTLHFYFLDLQTVQPLLGVPPEPFVFGFGGISLMERPTSWGRRLKRLVAAEVKRLMRRSLSRRMVPISVLDSSLLMSYCFGEFVDLVVELGVHCYQLLVGRLEFLLAGFQLFIGAL